MSVETSILFDTARIPTCLRLQDFLNERGIDITLEPIDDLASHAGYWPAKFDGHDSGFEWYFGTVADTFGEPFGAAAAATHAAAIVTHSDMRELVCGLYVAGALAVLGAGYFLDDDTEDFVSGEQALQMAKDIEGSEL